PARVAAPAPSRLSPRRARSLSCRDFAPPPWEVRSLFPRGPSCRRSPCGHGKGTELKRGTPRGPLSLQPISCACQAWVSRPPWPPRPPPAAEAGGPLGPGPRSPELRGRQPGKRSAKGFSA
ncbi:hypothetical protein H1C71_018854, partial [Ictidomys tridecemlineatus]